MNGTWGKIGAAIRAHFFKFSDAAQDMCVSTALCGTSADRRGVVLVDAPARRCASCARKLRLAKGKAAA